MPPRHLKVHTLISGPQPQIFQAKPLCQLLLAASTAHFLPVFPTVALGSAVVVRCQFWGLCLAPCT